MRKILCIAAFWLCGAALFAQEGVSWSMALVKDSRGIPFSRPVAMKSGESFTIVISAREDCFIYLVVQNSEKEVMVLLNQRLLAGETCYTGSIKLTPPSGSENFYAVVSRAEQKKLQNTIDARNKRANSRTGRNLLNAVLELRRGVSAFKENPEKPITMAGAFRGMEFEGTEFSGAAAYVKTIIINH